MPVTYASRLVLDQGSLAPVKSEKLHVCAGDVDRLRHLLLIKGCRSCRVRALCGTNSAAAGLSWRGAQDWDTPFRADAYEAACAPGWNAYWGPIRPEDREECTRLIA